MTRHLSCLNPDALTPPSGHSVERHASSARSQPYFASARSRHSLHLSACLESHCTAIYSKVSRCPIGVPRWTCCLQRHPSSISYLLAHQRHLARSRKQSTMRYPSWMTATRWTDCSTTRYHSQTFHHLQRYRFLQDLLATSKIHAMSLEGSASHRTSSIIRHHSQTR